MATHYAQQGALEIAYDSARKADDLLFWLMQRR